jgi:hypothetical protein
MGRDWAQTRLTRFPSVEFNDADDDERGVESIRRMDE